jgi:hypothetical protein
MEATIRETKSIAFCGLYCNNCNKFIRGKCPGCEKNEKATWCAIRKCCMDKAIQNCSECVEFSELKNCKKYNNVFSKVIQFVTSTDRELCIKIIREKGTDFFISEMDSNGKMSLPKKKK